MQVGEIWSDMPVHMTGSSEPVTDQVILEGCCCLLESMFKVTVGLGDAVLSYAPY